MQDETLSDLFGIELDAELAQRILDEGDNYSQYTDDLAQLIYQHRAKFREYLLEQGLILTSQNVEGFALAAVDGASASEPRGGGALVVAAAYKATLNDETQRGAARVVNLPNTTEIEAFATLLRIHLELSLLAPDKLGTDMLVILDHSFWGMMQQVSRALASYKTQRVQLQQTDRDPDTNAMQRAWKTLFKSSLGLDGSFLRMIKNKRVVSLAKTGVSQYFVNIFLEAQGANNPNILALGSALNDRALLRHILRPGEYTRPHSIYRTVQEGGTVKSWKRSRFATDFHDTRGIPDPFEARGKIFDEYGLPKEDSNQELQRNRLFVGYYRPYSWSRVYRIEFHEAMLANRNAPTEYDLLGQGERFQRVLDSVRKSINPEAKEPLAQVLADSRAKGAVRAALATLPERTFYKLRNKHRNDEEMLEVIDTLLSEERT